MTYHLCNRARRSFLLRVLCFSLPFDPLQEQCWNTTLGLYGQMPLFEYMTMTTHCLSDNLQFPSFCSGIIIVLLQAFQIIALSCSLPLYYYSAASFGVIDDPETCGSAARYSMLASDCQRGLIGDFINLLQQLHVAVAFFFSSCRH